MWPTPYISSREALFSWPLSTSQVYKSTNGTAVIGRNSLCNYFSLVYFFLVTLSESPESALCFQTGREFTPSLLQFQTAQHWVINSDKISISTNILGHADVTLQDYRFYQLCSNPRKSSLLSYIKMFAEIPNLHKFVLHEKLDFRCSDVQLFNTLSLTRLSGGLTFCEAMSNLWFVQLKRCLSWAPLIQTQNSHHANHRAIITTIIEQSPWQS